MTVTMAFSPCVAKICHIYSPHATALRSDPLCFSIQSHSLQIADFDSAVKPLSYGTLTCSLGSVHRPLLLYLIWPAPLFILLFHSDPSVSHYASITLHRHISYSPPETTSSPNGISHI